ncbi:MAG: hypothetical protein JSS29_03120 [Proteobacteria bacterium]|nr:hypothetical protein [Pseudomonadota bacterium]
MPRSYLNANAALYGLLGLVCAFAPGAIVHNVGFEPGGLVVPVEYLVIYGAFLCAVAVLFLCLARSGTGARVLGLELAIAISLLAVSYQLIARVFGWPEGALTLATGVLGLGLLMWGVALMAIARAPYTAG